MKINFTSDFHGNFPVLHNNSDVLVIAGDVAPNFSHLKLKDAELQLIWFRDNFIPWTKNNKFDACILTLGNHDTIGGYPEFLNPLKEEFKENNIHLLLDEGLEYNGVKFWGTPWVNIIENTDFVFMADQQKMRLRADIIPSDVEILISHSPVVGYGDIHFGKHLGDREILCAIHRLDKLKYFVCGHVHDMGGFTDYIGNTKIINAADHVFLESV